MVFTLFGYRKEVIITNLKKSFPEKSEQEIKKIHRDFKRFLCDMVVETIKSLSISEKEAVKRCRFSDLTLLDRLMPKRKK